MRAFTATELSRMQATQQSAMQDTAQHLQRTTTTDAYNRPVETFTPRLSYSCGFAPNPSQEGMENSQVPMADATLRIPLSVESVIDTDDRLKITHRFGVALAAPETFEIIGQPERGPSGLVYNLKRMTK